MLDSEWIGDRIVLGVQATGRQVIDSPATQYAVTFDLNGGTLANHGDSTQITKMVTYGENYGTLPEPTREGYRFLGWNGKNKFDISKLSNFGNISIEGEKIIINGKLYACSTSTKLKKVVPNLNVGEQVVFSFKTTCSRKYIYLYGYNGAVWMSGTSRTINEEMLDGIIIFYNEDNLTEENTVEISEIQIEQGSRVTAYEPYYITLSTKVVQNQNHTLTAIWEKE